MGSKLNATANLVGWRDKCWNKTLKRVLVSRSYDGHLFSGTVTLSFGTDRQLEFVNAWPNFERNVVIFRDIVDRKKTIVPNRV